MVKRKKTKKSRRLVVLTWPSTIVGNGTPITKIVSSILTPTQYEDRFYASDLHFRTEYAMSAYYL